MNANTKKLVAVVALAVVFVVVLYVQYGGSSQQPTELAVQVPQKPSTVAKSSEQKENAYTANNQSVDSLGAFNPFARSPQIESLYQQPVVAAASQSLAQNEPDAGKLVSQPAVFLKLPSDSLEATFEGPNGWVAMINSNIYKVGDLIDNPTGERYGVIVEISSGNVIISHENSDIQ